VKCSLILDLFCIVTIFYLHDASAQEKRVSREQLFSSHGNAWAGYDLNVVGVEEFVFYTSILPACINIKIPQQLVTFPGT
jgi:hypothetical protein